MSLLDVPCATGAAVHPNGLARRSEPEPREEADFTPRSAAMIQRRWGDCVWNIREDCLPLVEAIPPRIWQDPAQYNGAALVKENDGRRVWQIATAAGGVFAKVYVVNDLAARLKRLFRGPVCLSEWRAATYAREHGLPAIEPLGYAFHRPPWHSAGCVLLTRALPGAVPLDRYWAELASETDPARRRARTDRIIAAVADLIATAHQCGFRHVDLHAGNLVVIGEPDVSEVPRVVFVDLHGVCTGRPVTARAVVRNLAQLNQWFRRHAGVTDRIRFLKRYLQTHAAMRNRSSHARPLSLTLKQLATALDRRAHWHAHELYAQRDRRMIRTNKYFARIRIAGGWQGHVFLCAKHAVAGSQASVLAFERRQWQEWLRDPLRWVRAGDGVSVLKDSHSALVCRASLPVEPDPLPIICKRPRARSWPRRISSLLRASRNLRTWRRACALLHRDLPTARPLAVLERRRLGLRLDSILITEALTDAQDLDAFLEQRLTRLDAQRRRSLKNRIGAALSELIHRMQARGFVHRDFKASNLMIHWDEFDVGRVRLHLVDLDGLRLRRGTRPPPADCAWNALARLSVSLEKCRAVTHTDRARFLIQFLSGWGRDGSEWRRVWRDIESRCAPLRRRHERHRAWKLRHYGRD